MIAGRFNYTVKKGGATIECQLKNGAFYIKKIHDGQDLPEPEFKKYIVT